MADQTIAVLSYVAIGTGAVACAWALFMAARQPEQRKAHLGRAALFGVIVIVGLTSF